MILSKEDPTKIKEVLDLSLQEALSYLLYIIAKWRKESDEIQKQRKKNKR
jgi:hypothetical protein